MQVETILNTNRLEGYGTCFIAAEKNQGYICKGASGKFMVTFQSAQDAAVVIHTYL